MSLEMLLDLIRQNFSPAQGQILVRSFQQDPLVWQFIQDADVCQPYFEAVSDNIDAYSPGQMALWLVEQNTGISLPDVKQSGVPGEVKIRAAQAFQTTFNTGLPPADLYTAGLLALTLRERRVIKNNWNGLSDEIFIHRNQNALILNYHIWRSAFTCLFNMCDDFDVLSAEFLGSKSTHIVKTYLPIYIHTLLANLIDPSQLLEQMFTAFKHLSIDLQLESLQWLREYRQDELQLKLANQLIQTKSNRDFIARVFADIETFEAVNSEVDPLEKQVRYGLPEDLDRLAAIYYFNGNSQKALDTYQKSCDLLEFQKAQTRFQTLAGETHHVSSSNWLDIIKLLPHSKLARLYCARSLIQEHQYEEAQKHLGALPASAEKQFLQNLITPIDPASLDTLVKSQIPSQKTFKGKSPLGPSYFVHQAKLIAESDLFDIILQQDDGRISLQWIEKYLQTNINDRQGLSLARDLYEKTGRIKKAIELTACLERLEPEKISHKQDLARLYTQAERWEDAFTFLQDLAKSESPPRVEDLERFAEAALRTDHVDMAMSICQNLIKREPHNRKALILLGEVYMQKGDVLKAIQHMEAVVEMIPGEPDGWLTLAWLWHENDQTDRSLETLMKGVETSPGQPKLLRALGKAHLIAGAYHEALEPLIKAHKVEPDHPQGKLDLAQTYFQLGQPQKAYDLLETFIDNYQEYPDAARLLGHVLISLDKKESAEPVMLFAAAQFPEDLNTLLTTSQLVLDRVESALAIDPDERLDQIENILLKAEAEDPQHSQIKLHLADLARLRGNHQTAFDAYTKLSKGSENEKQMADWRLNYGLGQAAMGLGNQDVGLAALQAALSAQPSNLIVRHALADAMHASDLPGKADALALSSLKIAPQDLNNILWYAKFKTKTNQPTEAVRALKAALQINPQQIELELWLAKTLISAGSMEEAHQTISGFISSAEPNAELLHQAAYVCVHLNDLGLSTQALEKSLNKTTSFNSIRLMDLAMIYTFRDEHKKALDLLDIDQTYLLEHPEIAMLKSDLLCNLGHYDLARQTLQFIESQIEGDEENEVKSAVDRHPSPLLYTQDFSPKGFHFRYALVERILGDFTGAQKHFSIAQKMDPNDIRLRNIHVETAMMNLEFIPALALAEEVEQSSLLNQANTSDAVDLVCSQVEILLYQDETVGAQKQLSKISTAGAAYPRFLATASRIAILEGEIDLAQERLNQAVTAYQQEFGDLQSQTLAVIFRKLANLNSIAEASLALGDHCSAIETWKEISKMIDTQPLFNWRLLSALVTAAEFQRVSEILSITAHSQGKVYLSKEHHQMAERLLQDLHNQLPQDQIVCLKARIISAFTGEWPLHLNVDACLLGAEEAAAVLMGSLDDGFVQDILEAYPDDSRVLQAYGLYALSNNREDAVPFVEKALTYNTANPINHALLAYLTLHQPEHAVRSIETALTFWPEESEWHALAADLYAKLGNSEMAERHINFALEKQPENAAYWQVSAMLNAEANQLDQAKLDLEKSAAYQPDDPKAWTKMAEINRRMGDVPQAINNIRKASHLDPDNQNLVNFEMQLLFDQKNFNDLEVRAQEIRSIDPGNETATLFLAKAMANQGKFDQALKVLEKAVDQQPGNVQLALERIKIKRNQVGIEASLPELVALAEGQPNHPNVLTTLTDWLIQANRLEEAEEVAQTILRVMPEEAQVYVMLGRLQRMKGKLDQAIAHLTEAITLEPTSVDAYIELGKTYQERRDLEKAIDAFQKGSQANQSDPRPYYHAGLALKDCKDYSAAEIMLKQAKKYAPDDVNIIRQLGAVTALNLINNLREAN
jgi:tetratricopeptide (TPR) repeat protein